MNIKCSKCGEEVEITTQITWDHFLGYAGKKYVCRIYPVGKQGFRLASDRFISSFQMFNTLDEAKAEAQRLFDEWMGGLMNGDSNNERKENQ